MNQSDASRTVNNSIDAVSVVILTKDEAAGIANTLAHLKRFSDVWIIDSSSEDRTVEIAKELGAGVVHFSWNHQYPKKKQWSLDNAPLRNDWVLLLDADEYPSDDLIDEIAGLDLASGPRAYDIRLSYRFAGRFLRHGHRVVKRSLLDRSSTRFPEVNDLGAPGIREVEGHYQPQTAGKIGHLSGVLFHDDQDPVGTWFERHNRYSDWEAHLRTDREARLEIAAKRTLKGRVFDRVPMKPLIFFVYSFVLRAGFLDGRAGFDYAFALSTYYWQIEVKHRELRRTGHDEP